MAIIKSAKKRIKIAETRRRRNLVTKNRYKSLEKEMQKLLSEGKVAEAEKMMPQYQSLVDTGVKKNAFPKKRGANKKSKMVRDILRAKNAA